jgi:hypothetical protein
MCPLWVDGGRAYVIVQRPTLLPPDDRSGAYHAVFAWLKRVLRVEQRIQSRLQEEMRAFNGEGVVELARATLAGVAAAPQLAAETRAAGGAATAPAATAASKAGKQGQQAQRGARAPGGSPPDSSSTAAGSAATSGSAGEKTGFKPTPSSTAPSAAAGVANASSDATLAAAAATAARADRAVVRAARIVDPASASGHVVQDADGSLWLQVDFKPRRRVVMQLVGLAAAILLLLTMVVIIAAVALAKHTGRPGRG